ncbi:MAG: autotransporter outer membrane beta-barrel domain-containing protein [Gammaproteobacteria bacterium]|nr:autotransporter outer membrane beta-barrel domain-containing protein [Gammaproteobacteria bacterium]
MTTWRHLGIGSLILLGMANPAWAANAAFQSYFFDVCSSATGNLGTLCGVSAGGDLSGSSESSLNPSQSLANNDAGLNSARSRGDDPFGARAAEVVLGKSEVGPFGVLVQARGAFEELDRTPDVDNERGYESDLWALDIGFDQAVDEHFTWGGIFTIGRDNIDFDADVAGVNFAPTSSSGSIDADSLGLRLFGQWRMDAWYLEATAGYTSYSYDLTRKSVFQESTRTLPVVYSSTSANPDGDLVVASVAAGYDWTRGAWTIGLTSSLAYSSSEVDAYRESDDSLTGLAIVVDETERESMIGALSLDLTRAISMGGGVIVPQARLQYQHEFDRDAERASSRFVLDPTQTTFATVNDQPDEDYGAAAVGVVFVFANGWMPYLEAEMLFGYKDLDRYAFTAGIRREL